MKFLVVGHLCLDVIHPIEGSEVESYGGIYYSVGTLAALLDKSDRVFPVFGVNRDDYQVLIDHLSQFPNIDTSGIFKFDEPTNRVHLYYRDVQARIECSKDIARPIPFEEIRPHLSVDGVLVNMISGFDVKVGCFEYLTRFGIQNEVKISSAHRQPEETAEFVKNAEKNGFSVIVAAEGMAAHLPGVCASQTTLLSNCGTT